ncbi:MAG: DNA-binding response regulator [Saprospirales bacterium]|nr:MAG: DNA-binding response regulator [Saprospirales bacterium]
MGMIKVIIFEDNRHLRESISLVINNTEGMACSGAFANGDNLVMNVLTANPDLALMDINMPGMDGIECTKIIKRQFPKVKILMQTVFEENQKIQDAIKAGADGYILKKAKPGELIEAIRDVVEGRVAMSPEVAKKVLDIIRGNTTDAAKAHFRLSERELDVLKLLAEGASYKTIADKLFISFFTVQSHVKNIYGKMEVNSKTEAVSKAFQSKIV